jgi:3-hydroxyisobutyrate dehydrogenase
MRTGFVGLGNLGTPIVRTLLRGGWQVTVSDLAPDRVAECARAGADAAGSLNELADCELVALAVPDDDAVNGVLTGDGRLLDRLAPGSVVVLHSTVLPKTAVRLAELGAERGVAVLDAPVSGGPARAGEGDLTVMAGGDADAFERARPLLETVGSHVVHVGPPGAGSAVKLANQLMMFSTLAGVHEALALAGACGVREDRVLEVARTGLADSWVARNPDFFAQMAADYDRTGTPVRERSWSKDLWDVVATARDTDLRLPVAGLLSQHLADVVESHARRHEPPAR